MMGVVSYIELFTYSLVIVGIVALFHRKDR